MGYMGCAIAFLISCFSMTALCYFLGQHYYPVPYKIGSAMGYIISAGLLIYCVMQIQFSSLWISIPYHLLLLLLYTLGVVMVERKTIIPLKIRDKYAFLKWNVNFFWEICNSSIISKPLWVNRQIANDNFAPIFKRIIDKWWLFTEKRWMILKY